MAKRKFLITELGIALALGSYSAAEAQDSFFDITFDIEYVVGGSYAEEIDAALRRTLAEQGARLPDSVIRSAVNDAVRQVRQTEGQIGDFTARGCSSPDRQLCYTMQYQRLDKER